MTGLSQRIDAAMAAALDPDAEPAPLRALLARASAVADRIA